MMLPACGVRVTYCDGKIFAIHHSLNERFGKVKQKKISLFLFFVLVYAMRWRFPKKILF